MEYLFYVFNPEWSVKEKQLLQILEDGFHDMETRVVCYEMDKECYK